jgi:tol-pal system protein YbgF
MPMFDGGTRRLRAMCAGVVATALAGLVCVDAAQAQQAGQPRAQTKAATPAPQKAAPTEAASAGEAGLRQRVEQLEEQIVDMQVVIGTLESMNRGGGQGGQFRPSPSLNSGDDTRLAALEQQIRNLQAQVEQLTQQQRSQGGRATAAPPAVAGFGATTVQTDRDPIGQIVSQTAPGAVAAAPAFPQTGASDASAKQMYETAYGFLLNQDYASAEAGFDEFLRRFPNDALAGNAQYWLGESFFVRGQFKAAASAFLKGYQTYGRSSKAPDSLLKLAMSLDRLGQRDGACSAFGELSVKFPNAPGSVKNRADSERRRLGCA